MVFKRFGRFPDCKRGFGEDLDILMFDPEIWIDVVVNGFRSIGRTHTVRRF